VVAGAQTEAVSKLFRREPLPKIRRGRILLLEQQAVEIGLARWPHHQHHVIDRERGIDLALVARRDGQGVDVALEDRGGTRVYRSGDAIGGNSREDRKNQEKRGVAVKHGL
jgi:hypothetical protein